MAESSQPGRLSTKEKFAAQANYRKSVADRKEGVQMDGYNAILMQIKGAPWVCWFPFLMFASMTVVAVMCCTGHDQTTRAKRYLFFALDKHKLNFQK